MPSDLLVLIEWFRILARQTHLNVFREIVILLDFPSMCGCSKGIALDIREEVLRVATKLEGKCRDWDLGFANTSKYVALPFTISVHSALQVVP